MEILDFYENLLQAVCVEDTNGSGLLSAVTGPDKQQPVTIGGKRLVLPTKAILREGKKDDQIVFHPTSENVTRGESDVIKSLRDFIQWRLYSCITLLAEELGRVAASPSEHKKLGPKASKYLQELSDFDEKTYNALHSLLQRCDIKDPDRRIVTISLRQGSKTKNDGTLRSANVSFPIFEDLKNTENLEVFGMKMPSKKAKARILKLFEVIIGDDDEREEREYSYGTRDQSAPYLHALLTSFKRLAEKLNEVTEAHAKLLGEENTAALTINLAWVEGLDEFAKFRNQIPAQSGNEGSIRVTDKKDEPKKLSVAAPPAERRVEKEEVLPWDDQPEDNRSRDRSDRSRGERPGQIFRREEEKPARSSRNEPSDGRVSLDDYLSDLHGGSRQQGIFTRREMDDRRGGFSRGNSERGGRFGGDRGFRASRRSRF